MQNILNKTRKKKKKKKEGELANNYYICKGNQLFCLLNTFSFFLRIKEPFFWVPFLPALLQTLWYPQKLASSMTLSPGYN